MNPTSQAGPSAVAHGTPYCSACGYQLTGAVESSKCPECGKPLVEVLVRGSNFQGRRWRSKATLFGLPVVSIASGPVPGERYGKPVGIVAIGDLPLGVIAIGGMARGGIAIGGLALGFIALGGTTAGLVAVGGIAIGGLAVGGVAVGVVTVGSVGVYLLKAYSVVKIRIF